jgi:hypothetical protein
MYVWLTLGDYEFMHEVLCLLRCEIYKTYYGYMYMVVMILNNRKPTMETLF